MYGFVTTGEPLLLFTLFFFLNCFPLSYLLATVALVKNPVNWLRFVNPINNCITLIALESALDIKQRFPMLSQKNEWFLAKPGALAY